MMNCLTEQAKQKAKELNRLHPYINEDVWQQLLRSDQFTWLDKIPGTNRLSNLFKTLQQLFNDNTAANQKAAVVLSNFLSNSDGLNPLTLDNDGLPKLFFTTKNSNICYSSIEQLYSDYIENELDKRRDPQSIEIATNFRNACILQKMILQGQPMTRQLFNDYSDISILDRATQENFEVDANIRLLKMFLKLKQKNIILPTVQIGFYNNLANVQEYNKFTIIGDKNNFKLLGTSTQDYLQTFSELYTFLEDYSQYIVDDTKNSFIFVFDKEGQTLNLRVRPNITYQTILNSISKDAEDIRNAVNRVNDLEFKQKIITNNSTLKKFIQSYYFVKKFEFNSLKLYPNLELEKVLELTRFLEQPVIANFGKLQADDIFPELGLFSFGNNINPEFTARLDSMLVGLENPKITDLVNQIIELEGNTNLGLVAQALLPYIPDVNLEIVDKQFEINDNGVIRLTCGAYDPASNTIKLAREQYAYPDLVILHELLHAITHKKIAFDKATNEAANKIFNKAQKEVFKKYGANSYEELENSSANKRILHGFKNVNEFFSELWTNSDFIKELNSLGPKTAKTSLWTKIKKFLLNIIGISETSDLYNEASSVLQEILDSDYNGNSLLMDLSSLPEEFFEILPAAPNEQLLSLDDILKQSLNADLNLNEGLQKAVTLATKAFNTKSKDNNVGIISGKAGTGKTTVCKAIINQILSLQEKSLNVIVSAVANTAKNNLLEKIGKTKSKVQGLSVAALTGKRASYDKAGNLVWKLGSHREILGAKLRASSADIVIVDEASMLSEDIINTIKEFCPNALILFLGDERQVRPVSDKFDIFAPVFKTKNIFSYELTERVRQGEGSPILGVSDIYGDISANPGATDQEIEQQTQRVFAELNTNYSESTREGSILSLPQGTQIAVETLIPLAIKAIDTGNVNLLGIIPYRRETTTSFNNALRAEILKTKYGLQNVSTDPSDVLNYVGNVPYKKGEILILNQAIELYGRVIDNGTKFVVKEDAIIADPQDYVLNINGNQRAIAVLQVKVQWLENDILQEATLYLPLFKDKGYINYYIEQLKKQSYKALDPTPFKKEIIRVVSLFADISPAWALNVHRAQGSTYEVTYVPIEDYQTGYYASLNSQGKNPQEALVALSSQVYTAITRASNIVLLSNKNIQLPVDINILDLNNQIKISKYQQNPVESDAVEQVKRDDTIPERFLKQYDFLNFVTGSNLAFKNLNSSEGKSEAQNLALLFQQRESELNKLGRTFGKVKRNQYGIWDYQALLRNKDILYKRITEDNIEQIESELGEFPIITDLNVKAAQAVISPIYKETFKFGNRTLSEITPDFFRTVNNYYKSKVQHTDLLVRLHDGTLNIAFSDNFPSRNIYYGKPIKPIIINGWRVNEKGNKLYQVPISEDGKRDFVIYENNGRETIVFKKSNGYDDVRILLYSLGDSIVSVLPFLENVDDIEEINKLIKLSNTLSRFSTQERSLNQIRYNNELTLNQKKEALMNLYNDPEQEKLYSEKFANTLYNSFVKSLSITSSRIPTQALASFMNMQVAAFNPSGANDVFVSLWQLWLQGSKIINSNYKSAV